MDKYCKISKKCGGCAYQGIPYEEQLRKKETQVRKLLSDICPVRPIMGMEEPYHYRNKVHAAFARKHDGKVISGVYEEGTHRIVPVESCLIEDEKADAIIGTVRSLVNPFRIRIYNEDSGYGLLRHVMVRRGFQSGQILVVLVLASPILPAKNNFVKALRKEHPEITSIVLNVNAKRTSMVLGERNIVLYGKGYIEDTLCGKTFRISPQSFYQVNPVQTEKLYGKAVELAGLTGKERVIDAYCGIGTIGLIASGRAKEVIGVELNRDAVKDAIYNARINGIKNAKFYAGDAGEFMTVMAAEGEKADVLFMDPPRAGSGEAFLSSAVKLGPEKIIYISCNPETLARDLRYLKKKKYEVKEAWPVDCFAWTNHVESIVLLSKLHTKQTIEVEVKMSEMDLTAAESKATYEEIKEYVLKHTGLKVSNLYIAQVKEKCGIKERENYNIQKSDSCLHLICPVEKEKAIKDAFKYFKMI